jgi:hypothetical protein
MIRGWCQKHYQRMLKTGDPQSTKRIKGDDEARFWSYVDRRGDDECWPWTGCLDVGGYGTINIAGSGRKAHAWAYERFVGPMPEGTDEIDHKCHTRVETCHGVCPHRRCVNFLQIPGRLHLEAVPGDENKRRAHCPGLPHEIITGFHARWEAGEHIAFLAVEAGISKAGLHKRFRELDEAPRASRRASRRQRMTAGMAAELHARYLAGEGITTLAAEVGCDRTSIYARFRRMQESGDLSQVG